MLLPKIKKIPKNTNGRLAIPALAGLLVVRCPLIADEAQLSSTMQRCLSRALKDVETELYTHYTLNDVINDMQRIHAHSEVISPAPYGTQRTCVDVCW